MPVVNHAHPAHFAQPTIHAFVRRAEDDSRKMAWMAFCRDLDYLWAQYRAGGSTPTGWQEYVTAAGQAKTRYVYGDPYLVPVVSSW
jgi:hypothetical protein